MIKKKYPTPFIVSTSVLLSLLLYSFVLPVFAHYDPRKWNVVPRDLPPSLSFPLGTTTTGQDLFWLCSFALRNSIVLGIITASLSILIAFILGSIAGYIRGKVSGDLMTLLIDSFCLIPGLPVLMVFAILWRDYLNPVLIALILSIFGWAWPSRNIRSMVLSLRERGFTYTAQLSGYSMSKIFYHEYLPYIVRWLVVSFLGLLNWAIGMEVTLAVFGLSSLEEATIGSTIYWAMQYQAALRGVWWWILSPVAILMILVISLYIFMQSLSSAIWSK